MKQKQVDIRALDIETIDRVIEMAWEDRTPFEAIEAQFGLKEKGAIAVMRRYMQPSSSNCGASGLLPDPLNMPACVTLPLAVSNPKIRKHDHLGFLLKPVLITTKRAIKAMIIAQDAQDAQVCPICKVSITPGDTVHFSSDTPETCACLYARVCQNFGCINQGLENIGDMTRADIFKLGEILIKSVNAALER